MGGRDVRWKRTKKWNRGRRTGKKGGKEGGRKEKKRENTSILSVNYETASR